MSQSEDLAQPSPVRRVLRNGLVKGLAAGASAAACGAFATQWGLLAVALAVASCGVAVWFAHRAPRDGSTDLPTPAGSTPPAIGGLARQVVPVWQRNVDTARLHAEQNMNALTESFGSMMVELDRSLNEHHEAHRLDGESIDALLERNQPKVDALLDATRRIAQVKEEMARGIAEISDTVIEMVRLSKEVQTISRATHLLALNASVEAARAQGGGAMAAGFAAVAQEVQHLATQSRQTGFLLANRLGRVQERLQAIKRQGMTLDSDDDELIRQAQQQARAVVWALLSDLSSVARSQRNLQDSSQRVQGELERILVGLQSQDRLNQMLESVTTDMKRMHAWLDGAADEAAHSPHKWLERLEANYTMEEMRTSHHGTVQIEKASEVEFF